MRKIITLFALILAYGSGWSQYAMSASDFPQIGESRTYFNMDTTGITEGSGGTGLTWDFSGGTMTSLTRDLNILNPSAHVAGASFTGSSFVMDFSNGEYRFYTIDVDSMFFDGEVSLLNTPIPYSIRPKTYEFPVNLNDIQTDSLYSYYNTGAAGFAYRFGTYNTIFDADGTLMLPGGVTYNNCNRLVTFAQVKDSSQLFPLVNEITLTRIEWYTQGVSVPVMWTETRVIVLNGGAPTTTRDIFYLDTGFVAVDDAQISTQLNIYPNPAQEEFRVAYQLEGAAIVKVKVLDILGHQVKVIQENEQTAGSYEINVSANDLPAGLYFVKLTAGNSTETKKLLLK